MADKQSVSANQSGVSPARKAASTVILLIALAVLGIELRAGLGQRNSGQALQAKSEDGFFENLSLEDAKGLLAFSPTESVLQETEVETVYRYSWFSLLRPLVGQPPSELFLVARKTDPPRAVSFYASAEDGPDLPPSGPEEGADASSTTDTEITPIGSEEMGLETIAPRAPTRPAADEDAPADPASSTPPSSEPETPKEETPAPE